MNELDVNLPSGVSDFTPSDYQRARHLGNDHNAELPPVDPTVHEDSSVRESLPEAKTV